MTFGNYSRRCGMFGSLLFILVFIASNGIAHMFVQVGVDSNILVSKGRVYFVQSDGGLTALSLKSGNVQKRRLDRDFGRTLVATPRGILAIGDGKAAMLHPKTLTLLWETDAAKEANLTQAAFVGVDSSRQVVCHKLSNGRVFWRYKVLYGEPRITVLGNNVLVRSVNDEGETVEIGLLDLEKKMELFRMKNENHSLLFAYLDDNRVYIAMGKTDENPASSRLERIAVLDLNGKEIDALPLPNGLKGKTVEEIALNEKAIAVGNLFLHPTGAATKEKSTQDNLGPVAMTPPYNLFKRNNREKRLSSGVFRLLTREDRTGAERFVASWEAETGEWHGLLSYLGSSARTDNPVSRVVEFGGKLFIGTDIGHLECIDIATGRSEWLYVFLPKKEWISWNTAVGPLPSSEEMGKQSRKIAEQRAPFQQMVLLPNDFSEAASRWTEILSRSKADSVILDPALK